MAKISTYQRDIDIQDQDAFIGTESSNRLTRNFTAESVAKYLNIKGKISISAQMVFKFEVSNPTTGDFTGVVDGTPFSNITTLDVSIIDKSGQEVVEFVNYLIGNQILISEQNAISNFGHYSIDDYTIGGSFADSYTLTLTYIGGNGNITNAAYYDVAEFSLPSTETFTFSQGVPAAVWTINHTLEKHPSITVVSTANQVVIGDAAYTSTSQVVITFAEAFAGKAYLN